MGAEGRRIVLIRHGETTLNREDRLRGLADPPLDEVGVAQARALAPAMRTLGVSVIHCSPLSRAVQTATLIAETLAVPVRPDLRFTDRDYGAWTGELRRSVVERFGSVDDAPGVEPTEDVLTRVRPALLDVLLEEQGAVAVVTHDAVIRPLITELDPERGRVTAPNGSWNVIERAGAGWIVLAVDRRPDDGGGGL